MLSYKEVVVKINWLWYSTEGALLCPGSDQCVHCNGTHTHTQTKHDVSEELMQNINFNVELQLRSGDSGDGGGLRCTIITIDCYIKQKKM